MTDSPKNEDHDAGFNDAMDMIADFANEGDYAKAIFKIKAACNENTARNWYMLETLINMAASDFERSMDEADGAFAPKDLH